MRRVDERLNPNEPGNGDEAELRFPAHEQRDEYDQRQPADAQEVDDRAEYRGRQDGGRRAGFGLRRRGGSHPLKESGNAYRRQTSMWRARDPKDGGPTSSKRQPLRTKSSTSRI